MEKFLLLVREDLIRLRQMTEEELHQNIQEMSLWVESLAESGNFVSGEALLTTGNYVRQTHVMSDGPFIEAKEAISGFILIQAENLEQATSMAQTCPHVLAGKAVLEVRPILTFVNA